MVKFFIFLYLDFHIVPIYLVLYANLQVVMALYMQYRQILLVSHDIPGTICLPAGYGGLLQYIKIYFPSVSWYLNCTLTCKLWWPYICIHCTCIIYIVYNLYTLYIYPPNAVLQAVVALLFLIVGSLDINQEKNHKAQLGVQYVYYFKVPSEIMRKVINVDIKKIQITFSDISKKFIFTYKSNICINTLLKRFIYKE